MKYIYHHLGLGDHIICNGLVRHYCEIYGQVSVFCKKHNFDNVSYMYRDNLNINILPIGEDRDILEYISEKKIRQDVLFVGFQKLDYLRSQFPNIKFDEGFYRIMNLPFEYRFTKFYFERDLEKENNILQELNPNGDPFIFTHNVDKNKIRNDLKIIDNPTKYNIFNLMTLIESSTEVHLMESSIKNVVNSFKMSKPKFFYHQYVRGYPDYNNSQGLNKFEVII